MIQKEKSHLTADWRELLLLLFLAVVWSSSFLLIKLAVETIPPLTLAFGRMLVGFFVLYCVLILRGQSLPKSGIPWAIALFVGFIGNALPFTLIHWGEIRIDSGLAAVLMGCMPVIVVLLAHYFTPDEPITRSRAAGIAVGFAGLCLLVGRDALAGLGDAVIAQLAVIGGALAYAVNTVFIRKFAARHSGQGMAAASLLAGAAMLLPLSLLQEQALELSPAPAAIAALLLLGVFSTGIATLVYFRLLRTVGATVFSQVNYLIPAMGLVWGVLLLDEQPAWNQLAALPIILLGVGLVNRRPRRS